MILQVPNKIWASAFAARFADAQAVCAGLAAIHSVGIVHRDVTPGNVLRMEDNRLVITDFGLAIRTKDTTTFHGGTPKYMAPDSSSEAGRSSGPTSGSSATCYTRSFSSVTPSGHTTAIASSSNRRRTSSHRMSSVPSPNSAPSASRTTPTPAPKTRSRSLAA